MSSGTGARVAIDWYASDGTYLSTDYVTGFVDGTEVDGIAVTATAPAGAAYAIPYVAVPTGGELLFDNASFVPGAPPPPPAPFPIPTNVSDEYLADLPWDMTQRAFGPGGGGRRKHIPARAGWYGSKFDPAGGARAIVRSDGPLADLVGERLLITYRGQVHDRQVAVYVHSARTFPDELLADGEEILLSARAFLALANQGREYLHVTLEVLVEAPVEVTAATPGGSGGGGGGGGGGGSGGGGSDVPPGPVTEPVIT